MQFVAYYRVSTQKQGRSGLGLEAQRKAVQQHIGDHPLLDEFTEVESGKRDERPQLEAAIDYAMLTRSTLIVAKLDRLSRNATFLNQIFDSKLPIVFADMPDANRLTIGIMAQLAQWEAEQISKRTTEALQAAKRQGRKLGGDRGNLHTVSARGRSRSIATRQAKAEQRKAKLLPHVEAARAAGAVTLQAIADYLNERSIRPARADKWHPASVSRLLA